LTFRHIHLDFHTSPAVTGVGEAFRAEEFARVLTEAAVNSITIFGKCHHGMSYYPTKVGVRHPSLKIDLVGEMIEACHRQGIRVPVYISTMYDQRIWREHAEWRVCDEEGKPSGLRGFTGPLKADLGRICMNTPYLDYVVAQAHEILRNYEAGRDHSMTLRVPRFGCLGPSLHSRAGEAGPGFREAGRPAQTRGDGDRAQHPALRTDGARAQTQGGHLHQRSVRRAAAPDFLRRVRRRLHAHRN
jgi:hypothetical protein